MFKAFALVALSSASVCCAQINITSVTRFVTAQAGDGSGTQTFNANNQNDWNQQASRSFSTGNNSIRQTSSMGPWSLICNMNGSNNANSAGEAGNISSRYRVEFSINQPIDVYFNGGPGGTILGGTDYRLYNRNTNATVIGSYGNYYYHIPAGLYAYEQNLDTFDRGTLTANTTTTFRPGNDTCQYPKQVSHGIYTGTTVSASGTGDGVAACNSPAFAPAVWFRYTAAVTGPLKLTTCGSDFDTVLSVFQDGSCTPTAGDLIACNDDAPSDMVCGSGIRQSALILNVTAGTSYFIRLGGYNSAVGNYQLNVGPVNDLCDSMILAVEGSNEFDNTIANTDGAVACTAAGSNQINGDLWYYFVPPHSGLLNLDLCFSLFDTKIALYDRYSCGATGLVACNDDFCNLQSRIERFPVNAGQYYTIRVGGYNTRRGAGTLNLSLDAFCPSDFNHDGVVDFFDYLDFVQAFSGNLPAADFNHDNVVDFFDYLDFVQAFSSGC